ncbi:hypothetical protein FB566_5072 [Stackebrandtia endophytica]|uniref:Uncharacterized protein n=2 Tax=Stackebrandtia endophytica TaxID=1496996 RepID=A0A543B3R3_9ACTN|nr:hypothetical protein FB566_5072 [Stackebrandtia endophytica]
MGRVADMNVKCSGCGSSAMTEGFLDDSGQNSRGYTRWITGALATGVFGGAKQRGREKLPITGMRCEVCGLLSLYAKP